MSNWGWKEKLEALWRSSVQALTASPSEAAAIDLGTANTRIYLPHQGLVIDEPSMIALNIESNGIAAVGRTAKALALRQPPDVRVVRPIKNGTISDCDAASQMLSNFINSAFAGAAYSKLSLLICVPADITPLEQKAYEDVARNVGASKATLIEEPYAAAAGAELNLHSAKASMIVDLGAGTTDIAVISDGRVLYASTRRVGGDEIDRAIMRYLHLERKLEVDQDTAEELKIGLGNPAEAKASQSMVVRGRNLATGLPEEFNVTSEELVPLIQPICRIIKQHLYTALEEISTGASVDLLDSGITLSGGLSKLSGLAEHLSHELSLPVKAAAEPMLAAILGAGRFLEQESQASTEIETTEQESAGW